MHENVCPSVYNNIIIWICQYWWVFRHIHMPWMAGRCRRVWLMVRCQSGVLRLIVCVVSDQRPVSLTIFCPEFKFDGKFALLQFCYWPSDRNKFLHMPRQHSCRAMYTILQRPLHYNRGVSESKFPSNLNCDGKTASETGPRATRIASSSLKWFVELGSFTANNNL